MVVFGGELLIGVGGVGFVGKKGIGGGDGIKGRFG